MTISIHRTFGTSLNKYDLLEILKPFAIKPLGDKPFEFMNVNRYPADSDFYLRFSVCDVVTYGLPCPKVRPMVFYISIDSCSDAPGIFVESLLIFDVLPPVTKRKARNQLPDDLNRNAGRWVLKLWKAFRCVSLSKQKKINQLLFLRYYRLSLAPF